MLILVKEISQQPVLPSSPLIGRLLWFPSLGPKIWVAKYNVTRSHAESQEPQAKFPRCFPRSIAGGGRAEKSDGIVIIPRHSPQSDRDAGKEPSQLTMRLGVLGSSI